MTAKERVLATILRKPVDRLPVGIMGIEDAVANGVRQLLNAPATADLDRLLGVDFLSIRAPYTGPEFSWKPEADRMNFFECSDMTYADTGVVARPLQGMFTLQEIEQFAWPSVANYDFPGISDQLKKADGRVVMTDMWTPTFSQLCEMFGMETALYNLAAAPELMQAGAERITDLIIGHLRGVHKAAEGELLIFATADDFATQRGLLFSPDTWREIFKPSLARQFAAAKKLGLITWIHSCGNVSAVLPDLIEIGLDVFEPTQAHLPGMNPEWLKKEFGRNLTFFGAISTQTTLTFGTPDDVRREVRDRIRVFGEGGGYIVSPDHMILDNVPPENVVALYEAAGSLKDL